MGLLASAYALFQEHSFLIMVLVMMIARTVMRRRRDAQAHAGAAGAGADDTNSNVIVIRSAKQLVELVRQAQADDRLLVVDYYTTWCGPCKKAAPVVADMSRKWVSVAWCKVDCDKVQEAAKGIRSFPTFVIFKNGKAQYKQTGFSRDSILKALQDLGADLTSENQQRFKAREEKRLRKERADADMAAASVVGADKAQQKKGTAAAAAAEAATDITDID